MNRVGVRRIRYAVPPRKPIEEHQKSVSSSIDPHHAEWLKLNFGRLNYRNPSHAIDEAIRRMMEESGADSSKEKKGQDRKSA